MYLLGSEWWPKKDPITQREVCHACWNVLHRDCGECFSKDGLIQCDHLLGRGVKPVLKCLTCTFECDCIHLSEKQFVADQNATRKAARSEAKKREKAQAEAPENPLRAVNSEWKHTGA